MARWKKGQSGNPNGRPSEARAELKKALAAAGRKRNPSTTFLKHVAVKAYEDNAILKAVINKFLPDLKYIEGDIGATVNIILEDEKGQ